jgi:phosphatidylglycerophosphate synthase
MDGPIAESARSLQLTLLGVVVVPRGFEVHGQIGGLPPLLRAALAFQAAGVETVAFIGERLQLPEDARLRTPVVAVNDVSALPGHAWSLVVRADVTAHRGLPVRLAALLRERAQACMAGEGAAVIAAAPAALTAQVVGDLADERTPGLTQVPLEGSGPFAEFVVPARSADDRKRATELHLTSLRKPTGGVLENLYMRPLSKQLTRMLSATSVTPNAMSIVTLAIALLAAVFVALPDRGYVVLGGLLHIWMRVVDCVDGELARLRYQSSRLGEWLDTIGDGVGMAAFIAGVTVHVARSDPAMIAVGITGVVAWTLVQSLQVSAALISGGTGTFHRIEWGHRAPKKSVVERFVAKIEMLLRIDAISTYYGLAVIAGAMRPLLWGHAAMSVVALAYFAAQVLKLRAAAAR